VAVTFCPCTCCSAPEASKEPGTWALEEQLDEDQLPFLWLNSDRFFPAPEGLSVLWLAEGSPGSARFPDRRVAGGNDFLPSDQL
jgi:hypothetical protein